MQDTIFGKDFQLKNIYLILNLEYVTLTVTNKKYMSASTKLSTAVKALCYLSKIYPEAKNSSEIANYIGVNASKLRKILSMLVKNDIVLSTSGSTGGFTLKKKPDQLHLQEIYCSIEDRKAFYLDVNQNQNAESDITKLNSFFLDLFTDIQIDIENKMSMINLQTIIEKTSIN